MAYGLRPIPIPLADASFYGKQNKKNKMSKTDCLFKITIELQNPIEQGERITTHINIPCGKCGRCIQRRKMEWGFRMTYEMEDAKCAYFVTLTYAPETVPINKWGQKTLIRTRKQDLAIKAEEEGRKRITKKFKEQHVDRSIQGFFKRLRQNQKRLKDSIEAYKHNLKRTDKILFYCAGEYGTQRQRPHYHAIIYNASEKAILKSWDLGDVHIVKANEATIAYCMKYLDKRFNNEQPTNKEPEFNEMSEGIGKRYAERNGHWHRQNIDMLFVTTRKGLRIPMPKYLRHLIFSEEARYEQVLLVTDKIETIREEAIKKHGATKYNEQQRKLKISSQERFKKSIKKRNVD